VPFGRAANALSCGAKTVNGPGPLNASTKPAAFTASTNVLKFLLLWLFQQYFSFSIT